MYGKVTSWRGYQGRGTGLEEPGGCLGRAEKDNPGRMNRQVVQNLEMKGLVHGKDGPSYSQSQRSHEVGQEMQAETS